MLLLLLLFVWHQTSCCRCRCLSCNSSLSRPSLLLVLLLLLLYHLPVVLLLHPLLLLLLLIHTSVTQSVTRGVTRHCVTGLMVRHELRREVVLLSQQQCSQELPTQNFGWNCSSQAACLPGLQQIVPGLSPLCLRP
jgi:hypothetical protein